jgi:hypothetical protein
LTVERVEVQNWLKDETGSDDELEARGHAKSHFGQFVRGERIDDLYFMKRVEDRRSSPWSMAHGVWAISPRFDPQYRFFGCFATYDWFVALSKESREALQREDSWHTQIDKTLTLWGELFPGRFPFVPDTLGEFVSYAEKRDDRW